MPSTNSPHVSNRIILAYKIGILLIPIFNITDWYVYPQLAKYFLYIRISMSLILAISLLIIKRSPSLANYLTGMGFLLVSSMLSFFCYLSGEGFNSSYYTGIILAVLTASVLLEWKPIPFGAMCLGMGFVHFGLLSSLPFDTQGFIMNLFIIGGGVFLGIFLNSFINMVQDKNEYLLKVFAHDLKNQLLAIQSNLHIIKEYPDKHPRYIPQAIQNLRSATIMVGNLMNVYESEEDQIQIQRQATQLKTIEKLLKDKWAFIFEAKGIKFQTQFPDREVYLDPQYTELVWDNLISNALEHTSDKGEVKVQVEIKNKELIIDFFNTGRFIPEEDRPYLFSKYEHKKRKTLYKKGLGLHFSKIIINLHGGDIKYIPSQGGNCFKVNFPLNF